MTLDKKLFRLRKKEGLSKAEVSEKLDVSRQAVSRWESGEARPSTDNFQALCKLYHVSLDYLLNENEDEPTVPTPVVSSIERRTEQAPPEKRKRWVRWLVISAVVVVVICGIFAYVNSKKEGSVHLNEIQGEKVVPLERQKFNFQ